MRDWLLTLLRCPFVECRSPLDLDANETEREVREGSLRCRRCHREYPITDGVVALYGPMPDESVKRGEIDGWRTLMGLGPRPEGAHSRAAPPSHAGTGLSSVTAATSWDGTGRCPAVVRFGDGLTLAVGFSDRSQVESVEVDASPIGRSSRLRLSDPFENHALSRGVVARVPPRLAGQSLSLPYRVRLGSGALLTGEIPVTVTSDPTLRPDFERLLALPDAPPQPNERPGERTYWRQSTLALDSCLALLGLRGDERILEVGAGSGWASRRFAERGCHVVALDINPENLAVATNYLYLTDVYFDRVLADAETLPFADESFDVVFGCAVLHHAASMPRLLAELRRVLTPGGRIVLLNETLRAITQSEAEALSVSPHELAAGVNEHAPTVVEYRGAFRASGLRCTARRTDALDPLFREEVFAQQGDVSAYTRARHWLARRRWLRPMSERLALLFESGAVSFVASKPPVAPGRLPARGPTSGELRRLAEDAQHLRDTIARLEAAKRWLEEHNQAKDGEIASLVREGAELRRAIALLEEGKAWLDAQVRAQAAEIGRLEAHTGDLRSAIGELEQGKAWLAGQVDALRDETERWRQEYERLKAWTLDQERTITALVAQNPERHGGG